MSSGDGLLRLQKTVVSRWPIPVGVASDSPVAATDVAFYRPGELLVDHTAARELERDLAGKRAQRLTRTPARSWRQRGEPVDLAVLDELGLQLWRIDAAPDELPGIV